MLNHHLEFSLVYLCRFHCSLIIIERGEEEENFHTLTHRIYCIVCLTRLCSVRHLLKPTAKVHTLNEKKKIGRSMSIDCARIDVCFSLFFLYYLFILFEMENQKRKKREKKWAQPVLILIIHFFSFPLYWNLCAAKSSLICFVFFSICSASLNSGNHLTSHIEVWGVSVWESCECIFQVNLALEFSIRKRTQMLKWIIIEMERQWQFPAGIRANANTNEIRAVAHQTHWLIREWLSSSAREIYRSVLSNKQGNDFDRASFYLAVGIQTEHGILGSMCVSGQPQRMTRLRSEEYCLSLIVIIENPRFNWLTKWQIRSIWMMNRCAFTPSRLP